MYMHAKNKLLILYGVDHFILTIKATSLATCCNIYRYILIKQLVAKIEYIFMILEI